MVSRNILWLLCLAAVFYAMLSYHFIFCEGSFRVLKKSRLTLDYTIFNVQGKRPKSILAIDDLRKDGIGPVLVDLGLISGDELRNLMDQMERRSR